MSQLTPLQRIKWLVLLRAGKLDHAQTPTAEQIDATYDTSAYLEDFREEVRCTGTDTGLPDLSFSRHYESSEVAAQCPDGVWVGWTYWHGGGKHGFPAEMPWMEYAYAVDVKEEEKLVVVRTFSVTP